VASLLFNKTKVSGSYVEHMRFHKPYLYGYKKPSVCQNRLWGGNLDGRRHDNVYRTKQNIIHKTMGNSDLKIPPILLTLTYENNEINRSKALKDWAKFIRNLRIICPTVSYLHVIEYQERGAIHFHAILFNVPIIFKWKIIGIWQDQLNHGFAFVKKTNGSLHVARYLTKYITKGDLSDINQRYFSSSHGLDKTLIYRNVPIQCILTRRAEPIYSNAFSTVDGNIISIDIYQLIDV
jgi:hypothetical protein